jgi:hypothetical protein
MVTVPDRAAVVLHPVPASNYPDAVAPGALNWACARGDAQLQSYFAERSLPMLPDLVQARDGLRCHILFEPTVRGFRALPEQARVSGLWISPNTVSLLSGRQEVIGDSLDVARQMLKTIRRPLDVTLLLSGSDVSESYQRQSVQRNFPGTAHRIEVHRTTGLDGDPWVQDFLKAGSVGAEPWMLIPRQAFEGDPGNGSKYRPLLDSLNGPRTARSKLSWEGGDLQFTVDPSDPKRLMMLFGLSAKRYVHESISFAEFAYLLQLEFGVDRAVYLGDLTPHVDYLMTILPNDPVALVSEPVCGSLRLARAAMDELLSRFVQGVPAELVALNEALKGAEGPSRRAAMVQVVQAARRAEPGWRRQFDQQAMQLIRTHQASHCPADPDGCLQGKELEILGRDHPDLLRTWVRAAHFAANEAIGAVRLLQIIESQVSECDQTLQAGFDKSAAALASVGYTVVRVPWVPGTAERAMPWAGISYVNGAVVDHQVFVPAFRLGAVETAWFAELKAKLPKSYRVVPVDARYLLMTNGGVHCALALERSTQHLAMKRQLTPIPTSGAFALAARPQPAGVEPHLRATR